MAEKTGTPDWERIESHYRAGTLSLREIAAADGNVTEGAIRKRAKRDGWERDLGPKIRAKADALVRKEVVRSTGTQATEQQTIDENARAIVGIKLGHRTDIAKGRGLVAKLLAEVEGLTDRPDLIEELQQALVDPGDDGQAAEQRRRKLADMLQRVTELPARVTAVKGLAEAMKNLIGLERQAWGLDVDGAGGGSYEEFLQSLST